MTEKTRREHIFDIISDIVSDMLYYDRKEDEEMPVGSIEEAIKEKEITVGEISVHFAKELKRGIS